MGQIVSRGLTCGNRIGMMESHISIHTFPARGFISADVYTCKNGLDVDAIKDFFRARFKIADEEVHFIKRGTRYPLHNIF